MANREETLFEELNDALKNLRSVKSFLDDEDIEKMGKFFDRFKEQINEMSGKLQEQNNVIKSVVQDISSYYETVSDQQNRFKREIKEIEKLGEQGKFEEAVSSMDKLAKSIESLGENATDSEKEFLKLAKPMEDAAKLIADITELYAKQNKENHMLKNILKSNKTGVDNIFKGLGIRYMGQEDNISPLYAGIKDLLKDSNANTLMLGMNAKIETIENFMEPLNLAVNAIEIFKNKTFELTKALDEQFAAFEKTTGMIDLYNDQILDSFNEVRFFGVSLEEVQKQMIANVTEIRNFSETSKNAQTQITSFGAAVSRLGGDTAQTAKIFSFFMDSLHQGVNQAIGSFSRLLGVSKVINQSLSMVQKDFLSVLPNIAKFGSQTINVFAQMAGTAKTLNLEMSELAAIANQFDTFETAASTVGRLNAILGGPYLNTIQLMNQNEAERVQTLVAGFKATNKNWEALGKYERQALATAAGITDMTVAERLFSGSLSDVSKYTREQTIKQKELNEQNKNASTLAEKWSAFLSSISLILSPILDVLHAVADAFLSLANIFGNKFGAALIGTIGGLIALRLAFKGFSILTGIGSLFKSFGNIAEKAGDITAGVGNKLEKVASPGLAARIGGFFTTIGAGIKAFASSIAKAGPQILATAAIVGASVGIVKALIGIGEGIADIFSESPLEEFQNEMEDLSEAINKTGFDFSSKVLALNTLLESAKELSKVSVGNSLEQLEKFVVSTAKISPKVMQDNSSIINNLLETSSKVSAARTVASTDPVMLQILELLKNKNKEQKIELIVNLDGKQIGKSVYGYIEGRGNIRAIGADT